MFVKLQNKLPTVDWSKFKTNIILDQHYSEVRGAGSYFYKVGNITEFLMLHRSIFTIFPTSIAFCEFTGSGLVTPHRDKSDCVAMNLYLNTDDATTIFYNEVNADGTYHVVRDYKPYTTSLSSLVETGRFVAQTNDLYLLNVTEIHGIQKTTATPRTMLTYRWRNHKFNEILNSLKI